MVNASFENPRDFESGQQRLSASEAVSIFRTLPTANATPIQVLNVLMEQELKHRQKTYIAGCRQRFPPLRWKV